MFRKEDVHFPAEGGLAPRHLPRKEDACLRLS